MRPSIRSALRPAIPALVASSTAIFVSCRSGTRAGGVGARRGGPRPGRHGEVAHRVDTDEMHAMPGWGREALGRSLSGG